MPQKQSLKVHPGHGCQFIFQVTEQMFPEVLVYVEEYPI